jgi:hypothetical protein
MQNLTEGFSISRAERSDFVARLAPEVRALLERFHGEHADRAHELEQFFDDFTAGFHDACRASREQREAFVAELRKSVEQLRDDMREQHSIRAKQVAEFLSDFMTRFELDARTGREDREAFVADVRRSTREFLAAFRNDVAGASQAWREFATAGGSRVTA